MKKILFILIFAVGAISYGKAQGTEAMCSSDEREIQNHSLLNVFPNPSQGVFNVIYGSVTECPPEGWGGTVMINIADAYGKPVYTETILEFDGEYNKTIDLREKEKGIYFVEIIIGREKRMKRAFVN